MADPRFYRNRGPFALAAICAKAGIEMPAGADGAAQLHDLASLDGAAAAHLAFFTGEKNRADAFARSRAGFCLVPAQHAMRNAPAGMTVLPCASVPQAFAAIALLFYPDWPGVPVEAAGIHATAKLGRNVRVGQGAVIGAHAEIGDGVRVGDEAEIGPGVTIGQGCEVGAAASIYYAHIGDRVAIGAAAQIGEPDPSGAPALGRVIVQDRAQIGAASILHRGVLNDTVIGDGSRIDARIRIGSDTQIGRHCVAVAKPASAGGAVGDFTVLAGEDSGGIPAKPI